MPKNSDISNEEASLEEYEQPKKRARTTSQPVPARPIASAKCNPQRSSGAQHITGLNDFADEILLHIAGYLPLNALHSYAATSRNARDVAESEKITPVRRAQAKFCKLAKRYLNKDYSAGLTSKQADEILDNFIGFTQGSEEAFIYQYAFSHASESKQLNFMSAKIDTNQPLLDFVQNTYTMMPLFKKLITPMQVKQIALHAISRSHGHLKYHANQEHGWIILNTLLEHCENKLDADTVARLQNHITRAIRAKATRHCTPFARSLLERLSRVTPIPTIDIEPQQNPHAAGLTPRALYYG